MIKKIYITHCSTKKNKLYKNNNLLTTPDKLYTSKRIIRFINQCKIKNQNWAILSDRYGIWFPHEKHTWYDIHPRNITGKQLDKLVLNFDKDLSMYDEIWYYYNPAKFHTLYKKLLDMTKLRDKVVMFSHLKEIEDN